MFVPVQCILYRDLSDATLNPPGGRFEVLETYFETYHHERALLGCQECGQRYYYEFYEEIDWEDGDDPAWSTYIPIRNSKDIAYLHALKSPMELRGVFPLLTDDWPKGPRPGPRWIGLPKDAA